MEDKHSKSKQEDFRAVEFMREVREEMSKEFEKNPESYLENARKAMDAFKKRQKNTGNKAA